MTETTTVTANGGTADVDVSNVQDSRIITVHVSGDANATDFDVVLLGTTNTSQTPHPVQDSSLSASGAKKQSQSLDASGEDVTVIFLHARGLVEAAARIVNNAGSDTTLDVTVSGES